MKTGNIRAVVWAFLAGALAVILVWVVSTRERSEANEQWLFRLFSSDAESLRGALTKYGADMTHEQVARFEKAIRLLESQDFEKRVVVFNFSICATASREGPMLKMDYVDELASLGQINYDPSPADDNTAGRVLIASEELSPPGTRHVGIFPLCVRLKTDERLTDNARPYREFHSEDDMSYLVVPPGTLESMLARRGKLILLDYNGRTLDRVGLDELEFIQWSNVARRPVDPNKARGR